MLLLAAYVAAAGCGAQSVGRKQQAAVHSQRGIDLAVARDFESALRELNAAVRLDPGGTSGYAHGALAWIYATCPNAGLRDGEKALLHAKRAVKIAAGEPSEWGAWCEWATLAAACAENGDFDGAIAAQQRAIELADQCEEVMGIQLRKNVRACLMLYEARRPLRTPHITLALLDDAWARRVFRGDFPEVAECYDVNRAAKKPKETEEMACFKRGVAEAHAGRYEEALLQWNESVRIDPDGEAGIVHGVLASLYAMCPDAKFRDGQKALAHANLAVKIAGKQRRESERWWAWAALAAASAENGDFEAAIAAQGRAIELADRGDYENSRQTQKNVRACLKLYEARRPLRTTHITIATVSNAWAERVLNGDFPEIAE